SSPTSDVPLSPRGQGDREIARSLRCGHRRRHRASRITTEPCARRCSVLTLPALIVHGGAGAVSEDERDQRQGAVERGLQAGWERIGDGALAAVAAAVGQLEDEPLLNAGIGACLNADGEVELDAGVMEGAELRAGAVAAVRDV